MRVAFVGLGVMGYPMAGYLAGAGHDVTVYNRTKARAAAWQDEHGGAVADTPAAAAETAEIVFSCVGDDPDVRAVMLSGDGVLESIRNGASIVDHTTASANIAREIYGIAKDQNVGFLDAPLSGGQAGAEAGQLSIMVGGDADVFKRAQPVMQCYAKACIRIGPVGAGQLAKMANQICITGVVQGLSEALHFVKRAGLDPAAVIGAISKGAAQSWQMENRWETMVNNKFDFGFAVEWMRKDLRIALDEAGSNGATLEMTRIVDGYYKEVQELGGNRWDTSSLIARLENGEY